MSSKDGDQCPAIIQPAMMEASSYQLRLIAAASAMCDAALNGSVSGPF